MNVALSLFALTLLAADAPQPPVEVKPSISLGTFKVVGTTSTAPSKASPIVFQFQVIEMTGLDWRSTHQAKLTSATIRAGISVWTAPSSLVPELAKAAGASPTRVKLVADSERYAHFRSNGHQVAASIDTPVASSPMMEKTREGIAATLTGRKLEQGVLTKVLIEETRVVAMHKVPVADSGNAPKDGAIQQVSIPEVAEADVGGEWLIPRDGVLILSLGVHTVADADSKAVVKERLALIEANPEAAKLGNIEFKRHADNKGEVHSITVTKHELPAAIPLPFAALPSRSLPEPCDEQGKPVTKLPPLPEYLPPPTTFSTSSEPCASPQADPVKGPDLVVDRVIDHELKAAGYDVLSAEGVDSEACCSGKDEPKVTEGKFGKLRTFKMRLPGKGVGTIEIRGIVLPLANDAAPPLTLPKAK